jgi:hypothetical protein
MVPVLMRYPADCEVAGVATITGETWEKARAAMGWRDLPGDLENPVYGNPVNVVLGFLKLGWLVDLVDVSDLLDGHADPGRTLVLIHGGETWVEGTLNQHWAVWAGVREEDGKHLFYWGQGTKPVAISANVLAGLVTLGWPNCILQARPGSWWKWIWVTIRDFFRR